jgi:hypothetical protein
MRGAATAIKAIGDGRRVAEKIIGESNMQYTKPDVGSSRQDTEQLLIKKGIRKPAILIDELPVEKTEKFCTDKPCNDLAGGTERGLKMFALRPDLQCLR